MEAESDILLEVSGRYANDDNALKLRMMHLLYESVKDTGGTVVIPNSLASAFKDLDSGDLEKLNALRGNL